MNVAICLINELCIIGLRYYIGYNTNTSYLVLWRGCVCPESDLQCLISSELRLANNTIISCPTLYTTNYKLISISYYRICMIFKSYLSNVYYLLLTKITLFYWINILRYLRKGYFTQNLLFLKYIFQINIIN